ncbi:AAA family ATPase [Duganella sp. FT92W]|uniref:DNA 3'-5' helicase n=1 Tax=Pseudoduganella rivuli TaxID=2666085 RepID=A0A7X2IIQ4_9BURK|nr:ATP-dependent helicase [Pseudoduganella rivuli]MRV70614.1 AAA family ATPase [Pseudoduganella rivuli]
MTFPPRRIRPEAWLPVGVTALEANALKVVRSDAHRSVLAGPGAGKTELLAQRAAYLLQTGICPSPRRILAIAFKRDAARNLSSRVATRCHPGHASRLDSVTFDAFAKSLLDRFGQTLPNEWRPTSDYEIVFSTDAIIRQVLQSTSKECTNAETAARIRAINIKTFERRHVVHQRLPNSKLPLTSWQNIAAKNYWQRMLRGQKCSQLTFPMIGRLVELLLRSNDSARLAFALTYSHVFMDEFQDITPIQYDLVYTLFRSSDTILTAVGDNKQQIMRWAMAMDASFDVFEKDFGAKRVRLLNNYRSSPELVRIQHILAQALDDKAPQPESQTETMVPGDCCAVWDFTSPEEEGKCLAAFIADEIAAHNLHPRNFAILVRQKSDSYAGSLASQFAAAGLLLRNEDASVGALKIQELLTEDLSIKCMQLLRAALTRGAGTAWTNTLLTLQELEPTGFDYSDINSRRLAKLLDEFASQLAQDYPAPPSSSKAMTALIAKVIDFLGRSRMRAIYPAYAQGNWLEEVEKCITEHLQASADSKTDWGEVLDAYDGIDAIGLMTIHKSKGLEYHTIIFVGLDDRAWWNYSNDEAEATAVFFVAFTRAKQRAIFTYCSSRGQRTEIQPLYDLLTKAGVSTVQIT